MSLLAQLSQVRSQAAEHVLEFYRLQEAACESAPWARRDGRTLKASEYCIPMQLLTEQIKRLETKGQTPFSGSPQPKGGGIWGKVRRARNWASRSFWRVGQPANQLGSQGLPISSFAGSVDEMASSLYEYPINRTIRQIESWEQVFGERKSLRLIFKGGPGSGKSFSLGQEVRRRLARARAEWEKCACSIHDLELPIFVKASALADAQGDRIEDALLSILPDVPASLAASLGTWWRRAFETEGGRRLFIVIDGLDELREENQGRFRERMKQLDGLKAASLVVSCRTMYFADRRNWINWADSSRTQVLELAPLGLEQQNELIGKLLESGTISHKSLSGLLKKNHSLSHFCRTPLLLTLTCLLHSEGVLSEKTSYALLYKAVTDRLLRGDWRDFALRPQWAQSASGVLRDAALLERTALLPAICWGLFENSPSENRFSLVQWQHAAERAIANNVNTNLVPAVLLSELESVGLVIDAGYDAQGDACYSFLHRTVLEYFAARGLVERHPESVWVKTVVQHIWCEVAWVEVIRFAASLAKDPTHLLASLAKEAGPNKADSNSALVGPLHQLGKICGGIAVTIVLFVPIVSFLLSKSSIWGSCRAKATEQMAEDMAKRNSALLALFPKQPEQAIVFVVHNFKGLLAFLLHELLWLYNFVFQLLYVAAAASPNPYLASHALQVAHYGQLIVSTLLVLLMLMCLGGLLASIAKKILYFAGLYQYKDPQILKQDDIFRTGLRIQAEVIGLNNNVPTWEVKRVMDELLASERTKGEMRTLDELLGRTESAHIHGADEDGSIPENLLLRFGGNDQGREMLTKYWLELVDKKCKGLQQATHKYEKLLGWFRKRLDSTRESELPALFTAEDFRKVSVRDLVLFLTRKNQDNPLTKYLFGKFTSDTQQLLKSSSDAARVSGFVAFFRDNFGDYACEFAATKVREEVVNALVDEFNTLLEEPSFYEPKRFERVELRAETRELLRQQPSEGEDLARLNRYLLEDAYAYQHLAKRQRIWARLVSKIGHLWLKRSFSQMRRSLKLSPFLSRALRGLALLPDEQTANRLTRLLEQSAKVTAHLMEVEETQDTFTWLDICVAGTLARVGTAEDAEKLVDFASRRLEERNPNTPSAVKELSLIEGRQRQAIAIALACIQDQWAARGKYSSEGKFWEILQAMPRGLVISELEQLAEKDEKHWARLVQFVCRSEDETAITWLHQAASDQTRPVLAKAAQEQLDSSWNKHWVDGAGWLEEQLLEIKKLLATTKLQYEDERKLDSAINKLVSYRWNYVQKVLLNNPDNVVSLYDKAILDKWFKSSDGSIYQGLGILANRPNGEIVKEVLIKWASDYYFHLNYRSEWKQQRLLLALGELEEKGEHPLFKMLATDHRNFFLRAIKAKDCSPIFYVALGKVGGNQALQELRRAAKRYKKSWEINYATANLLAERDDPQALEFLLKGKGLRGTSGKWEAEFGNEPTLWALAWSFGARVMEVDYAGTKEYLAVSQARGFKFLVRA